MSVPAASYDRWLVRSVVVAQFGPAFMFSGVAVALPAMGEDLRFSATTLGLIETIFLASSTAFLLPGGRLADMLPRGVIFRATLFGFGLMSLLIGCVSEAWAVLLLRFLQGLMAALSGAAGPALLGDLVPAERRGRVFGSMLGMAYAGLALGPLAAGWLVATYGWRSVFFVGAAQILIGGLPVLLRRIDRWRAPTGGMHVPSTVLVVLGMGCVVGAVSVGGHGGSPWPWAASAAALLLAFVAWQTRLRDPLLDLRALRQSPALRSALLVQVPLGMIDDEGRTARFKPFLRNPVMWAGFAVPAVLNSINALSHYHEFVTRVDIDLPLSLGPDVGMGVSSSTCARKRARN